MSLIDPIKEDPKAALFTEEKPEAKEAPAVPDKLNGKTPEEVYEMYLNAEKDRSRMANELGENRKLIDRVLQLEETRTTEQKVEDEVSLDATDLLADPVTTLDNYFSNRERKLREEYDSRIQQLEGQLGHQSLNQKHQNVDDVVNSPEFLEFVQESPVRVMAAQAVVQNGDVNALDALLTEYERANAAPAQEATDPGEAGRQAARAASLESSASSGGTSSGKIYSRQQIIRMKIEDPEAYSDPAFQDELKRAYLEKRVR